MTSWDLLCPDIAFVRADGLRAIGGIPDGFFHGGPDLIVEVLSPSDRPAQVRATIRQYFENGTRLAWVIAPKSQTAQIWWPDGTIVDVPASGTLDGVEVLPRLLPAAGRPVL